MSRRKMLSKSEKGDYLSNSSFEDDFNENQISLDGSPKSKIKRKKTKLTEQQKFEKS